MLHFIRRLIPRPLFGLYHRTLAALATIVYRSPSNNLIVIGVTGTSGKSTVVYLLARLFEQAGFRVGAASTIFFKVGEKEWLNDTKMTMIGRFGLQRLLRRMAVANCQYAIVETTSQGIEQFRHRGINYDVVVLTNLYPEHLEAHGGFENYKNAKLKLFQSLANNSTKIIAGQTIPKTIIVNLDSDHALDFINQPADYHYGYTIHGAQQPAAEVIAGTDVTTTAEGASFLVAGHQYSVPLLGEHNVMNILAAITVGASQGLSYTKMAELFSTVTGIPGRLEFIAGEQPFTVIVDYAFEPRALAALYDVVSQITTGAIIHVLGGAGGGRDTARRPVIGQLAGERAAYVIVTNEDPYDEDPTAIIDQVAAGAMTAGKKQGTDLFKILDRRKAISKALSLAQSGDIVLITGKGSEQAIVTKHNHKIPWDDRQVVREELEKLTKTSHSV